MIKFYNIPRGNIKTIKPQKGEFENRIRKLCDSILILDLVKKLRWLLVKS